MAIKTYRPTTQTLRYRTSVTTDDITSSKPHKPLVEGKIRTGGRRNSGDTTMRFRGGAAGWNRGTDPTQSSEIPARININTATQAELESLPGVVPVIARRIVEGRPYRSVEDLDRVKRIGKKRLEEIRPLVTAQ